MKLVTFMCLLRYHTVQTNVPYHHHEQLIDGNGKVQHHRTQCPPSTKGLLPSGWLMLHVMHMSQGHVCVQHMTQSWSLCTTDRLVEWLVGWLID